MKPLIFLMLAGLSSALAGPVALEEDARSDRKENDHNDVLAGLLSKVQLVSDNVNYLKYHIEKQPIVESLKSIAQLELIDQKASLLKNQTLQKYFEIIDQVFDNDVMNELRKTDKLNTLGAKLDLLNKIRRCLVNLLQTTLYQNANDLIRAVATYINAIDSMIIKLDLREEIDVSHLQTTIKEVLKFVQKFLLAFDEKDYKCEDINIF